MAGRNLQGAKVTGVVPERAQLPKYGHRPGWSAERPGTLEGNTGAGVQFREASKSRLHNPDPTWAKFQFRDFTDERLLVMTPVNPPADPQKPDPDVYRVSWNEGSFKVRGLKLLMEAAQVELRAGISYELTTAVGEDEDGSVVWGSWTKAVLVPKPAPVKSDGKGSDLDSDDDDDEDTGDSNVAAANQP